MAYNRNGLVTYARMQILRTPTIRLSDVARECEVSAATLRRAIRAESGASLRRWRELQLQSLAEGMLVGNRAFSVKEVSAAMGFASQQSFARWFRRRVGLSPSAFRSSR